MPWTERETRPSFTMDTWNAVADYLAAGLSKPPASFINAGIGRSIAEDWNLAVGRMLDQRTSFGFAKAARNDWRGGKAIRQPGCPEELKAFLDGIAAAGATSVEEHGSDGLKAAYERNPKAFDDALKYLCEGAYRSATQEPARFVA